MMKNSTAHSGDIGMWMMASVNTMKARPGPSDTWKEGRKGGRGGREGGEGRGEKRIERWGEGEGMEGEGKRGGEE